MASQGEAGALRPPSVPELLRSMVLASPLRMDPVQLQPLHLFQVFLLGGQVHLRWAQLMGSSKPETSSSTNETAPQNSHTKHWHWWLMVALNIFFLVAGQTASTLLGRFYYNQDGNSKWTSTFAQTAGFPVLLVALYLFRSICATSYGFLVLETYMCLLLESVFATGVHLVLETYMCLLLESMFAIMLISRQNM